MPENKNLNETLLFDPDQLKQLAAKLLELRRANPGASVDTVLAGMDETTRSLYREPLMQYVTSDEAVTDISLQATQMFEGTIDPESNAFFSSGGGQSAVDGTIDTGSQTIQPEMQSFTPPAARQVPSSVEPSQASETSSQSPAVRSSSGASPKSKPAADADSKSKPAPLPKNIGKFEIKRELGRGAFGVVYLGFDSELQRNVAIKLSLVSDKKIQDRLRIEASKAAQIESDGIVPVYHIGSTESGAVYIVQKFIQGNTLRGVLEQNGPLSPSGAVRMIRDIALALEPAHLRDILHRDLKPDNVLIDENGKPWIADFGLAISEEEQQGRRGELAGTPAYMSPEQIKGRIDFLDPRSDIWSLGVMFYELLSGKLPFNGRDRRALAEQICEMDPRPLHQRSPLLSEDINTVFLRCCAKKPAERFVSVRELAIALEQLMAGGLSDQNIRGVGSTHLMNDSTLVRDSTLIRSGTAVGFPGQPSRLGSSQHPLTQHPSSQHPSSQHASSHPSTGTIVPSHLSSHRESMSGSAYSSTSGSTSTTKSSPWWIRTIGQVVTLGLMIAASVFATQFFFADKVVPVPPIPDPIPNVIPDEEPGGDRVVPVVPPPIEEMPKIDADGSPEKPWVVAANGPASHRTIQAAIDAGPAGAVIQVASGVYSEQLRIERPVTLIGPKDLALCELESADGPPLTIVCLGDGQVSLKNFSINAKGHRTTEEFNAIDLEAGTLLIESCSIKTSTFNCIKTSPDTSLSVVGSQFLEAKQFAISTVNSSHVFAKDCTFLSSGIQVIGGPAKIEACIFEGKEGIYADRTLPALVDVKGCTFQSSFDYGVCATGNSKLSLFDCTFLGCRLGAWACASDESDLGEENQELPGSIDIADCDFDDCDAAIEITNAEIIVRDNSVLSNGRVGANIAGGKLRIEKTRIEKMKEVGVAALLDSVIELVDTAIIGTGGRAIQMTDDSKQLLVQGGSIEESGDVGIWMSERPKNVKLTGVTFANNRSSGIWSEAESVVLNVDSCVFTGGTIAMYVKAQAVESFLNMLSVKFDGMSQNAITASGNLRIKYENCDFGSLAQDKQVLAYQPATIEAVVREVE